MVIDDFNGDAFDAEVWVWDQGQNVGPVEYDGTSVILLQNMDLMLASDFTIAASVDNLHEFSGSFSATMQFSCADVVGDCQITVQVSDAFNTGNGFGVWYELETDDMGGVIYSGFRLDDDNWGLDNGNQSIEQGISSSWNQASNLALAYDVETGAIDVTLTDGAGVEHMLSAAATMPTENYVVALAISGNAAAENDPIGRIDDFSSDLQMCVP